ncbi:MAG: PrsW family intramembrane metalloprotease [Patescibacteria group bacterium]|nr:PrsW family intramembrane metalloprotease [Patescibacteria group bacterium]
MSSISLIYALLASIVPVFLWLCFWLREDRLHPEPRLFIFLAFLGGMLAVPIVLPIEQFVNNHFSDTSTILFLWAFTEEFTKYFIGFAFVLRRKFVDEPIDVIIYMITIALGFAALENTFFILKPILEGDVVRTIITSDMRFMGATLLHVVSSAIIGSAIALSFFKNKIIKIFSLSFGIILATFFHMIFNFFITKGQVSDAFTVFVSVWVASIILLLIFEKVKLFTPVQESNV